MVTTNIHQEQVARGQIIRAAKTWRNIGSSGTRDLICYYGKQEVNRFAYEFYVRLLDQYLAAGQQTTSHLDVRVPTNATLGLKDCLIGIGEFDPGGGAMTWDAVEVIPDAIDILPASSMASHESLLQPGILSATSTVDVARGQIVAAYKTWKMVGAAGYRSVAAMYGKGNSLETFLWEFGVIKLNEYCGAGQQVTTTLEREVPLSATLGLKDALVGVGEYNEGTHEMTYDDYDIIPDAIHVYEPAGPAADQIAIEFIAL